MQHIQLQLMLLTPFYFQHGESSRTVREQHISDNNRGSTKELINQFCSMPPASSPSSDANCDYHFAVFLTGNQKLFPAKILDSSRKSRQLKCAHEVTRRWRRTRLKETSAVQVCAPGLKEKQARKLFLSNCIKNQNNNPK